ncbi:MAG: CAP domain-containing protein [Pelotomaculum sp.]
MTIIKRVLTVIVPCLLLVLAAAPTAMAANATAANPLQAYWNKYYGSSFNQKPVITPAKPTTPSTPAAPTTPTTPTPSNASGLTADEALLLELVNQERVKAGLPILTVDQQLTKLARLKSQDMVQNNYFSHTSPTYGSPYNMERKAGYSARVMGAENIAKAATTERAHQLFIGSAGHKANILNPLHDAIGIGIVKTSSGVTVTQLFSGN